MSTNSALGTNASVISGSRIAWNPAKPLGGETPNLWLTSRSGLSMVDSVAGNNATITLPTLQQSNNPLICIDNGGLDIGGTDFTFAVWCKPNSVSKASYAYIGGKPLTNGAVNGHYYIYQDITTGKIIISVKPTGTEKVINTNIDFTTLDWSLLAITIDQTNLLIHVYVNNVEIGTGTAYTGTFPTMSNAYKFMLGKGQVVGGGTYQYNINCFFSEAFIYSRALNTTELTSLYNRNIVSGARAHWVIDGINPTDLSGNGRHLATISGDASNTSIVYSNGGSRYLLNNGYSLYKYSGISTLKNIYVGYSLAGTPLASPGLIAGYNKISDHAGNTGQHNLADSYLTFVGANWSRDNATIFGDMARQTALTNGEGNWYLSGTPKAWHISEFNRVKFNSYFNSSYKGTAFPKVTNNSIDDRRVLSEVIGYASNKTGGDYNKVLKYTGDKGKSWDISYFFSDTHYCYSRGSKILAYDGNTTFSLSTDGGSTFPITKSVAGYSGGECDFAYIGSSGEIYFASSTKVYYSFDNLSTVNELSVLDIGGGAYTPGTAQNYMRIQPDTITFVNGTEIVVFGNYSITVNTSETNARIWQLIVGQTSMKCVYRFNGVILARHTECIIQNPVDSSFYICTGDNDNGKINIIRGVYTTGTDSWTFTKLNSVPHSNEGDYWHWIGVHFYNNYLYAGIEDVNKTGTRGIYRMADNADLDTWSNFTKLFSLPAEIGLSLKGYGSKIVMAQGNDKLLTISNNGNDFYLWKLIGGVALAGFEGGYFGFTDPDINGYMRGDIAATGETWADPTKGQVIMLKIVDE